MEDRVTNRLFESCNIFDTIVNHRYFVEVSIILFLNKSDLLEQKVKRISIKDYFPAYNLDPHNVNQVQNFILNMFDARRRERSKALFHHFTTAVDTDNIKYVFTFVRDTILSENLRRLMLQWWRVPSVFNRQVFLLEMLAKGKCLESCRDKFKYLCCKFGRVCSNGTHYSCHSSASWQWERLCKSHLSYIFFSFFSLFNGHSVWNWSAIVNIPVIIYIFFLLTSVSWFLSCVYGVSGIGFNRKVSC